MGGRGAQRCAPSATSSPRRGHWSSGRGVRGDPAAGRLVADVPRGARGGTLLGRLRHLGACDQQRSRPRSVALAGGPPHCAMRCRTSAPASGSTSSARLRRSPGSCKPPMRRVTPVLRRVAAEGSQWWRRQGSHKSWDSDLQVGFALEEGRLEDAAVAYEHLLAGCPATKRQYHHRRSGWRLGRA